MKDKRYLMTDVFYKRAYNEQWYRFAPSEGDPTGKIYEFWLPETIRCTMEEVISYLNMYVSCICEKKLKDINALKFNLRLQPDKDDENAGYANLHKWETQEILFQKQN